MLCILLILVNSIYETLYHENRDLHIRLGQSFENESVEKYAARLVNEIEYNTKKIKYSIKSEKISYRKDRFCTVVSILKEQQNPQVIYKLYSFNYHEIHLSLYRR